MDRTVREYTMKHECHQLLCEGRIHPECCVTKLVEPKIRLFVSDTIITLPQDYPVEVYYAFSAPVADASRKRLLLCFFRVSECGKLDHIGTVKSDEFIEAVDFRSFRTLALDFILIEGTCEKLLFVDMPRYTLSFDYSETVGDNLFPEDFLSSLFSGYSSIRTNMRNKTADCLSLF